MTFKKLVLSGIEQKNYRTEKDQEFLRKPKWQKEIRPTIMLRDNNTCNYCGYQQKNNHVHHIDGNHRNNSHDNLEVICFHCHMIKHSGLFSYLHRKVIIFEKSDYNQNQIQQISTKMRLQRKTDNEIIEFLGLKNRKFYKPQQDYLSKLFGFVTSRPLRKMDEWQKWFDLVRIIPLANEDERNRLLDIENHPKLKNGEFTKEVQKILRDIYDFHTKGFTLTDEQRIRLAKQEDNEIKKKAQTYDSGIDIIDNSKS